MIMDKIDPNSNREFKKNFYFILFCCQLIKNYKPLRMSIDGVGTISDDDDDTKRTVDYSRFTVCSEKVAVVYNF